MTHKVRVSPPTSHLLTVMKSFLFCSFMHMHAQAMNEYCGGEMSTEVVVDQNLWMEIVGHRWK